MKSKYILPLFLATFLLVGCEDIKWAEKNPSSLSPEEVTTIYYQEDFFKHIEEAIDNLQAVELKTEKTFTWGESVYTASSHSYENYEKGNVKDFAVQTQYENDEGRLDEIVLVQGDTYWSKVGPFSWQESENPQKQNLLFSQWLNFVLHDFEELQIEVLDEGKQLVLKNHLTQEEMEDLKYRLDLPLMLSPKAEIALDTEYTYDNEAKKFTKMLLNFTIHDLGETFTYDVTGEPSYEDEPYDLSKDTFMITHVDPNFDTMNKNPFYYYYETAIHIQMGEEEEDYLLSTNKLFDQVWMLMPASIKDEEVQPFGLVHQGTHYYLENDSVKEEKWEMHDYYREFVDLYEGAEDLIDVEGAEEGVRHQRLAFEDFATFKEQIPYPRVDDLAYEVESLYAIDFLLDEETEQLQTVFIWSITGEEEAPAKSITINFSNTNQYTPNLLSDSVDQRLWEALSK